MEERLFCTIRKLDFIQPCVYMIQAISQTAGFSSQQDKFRVENEDACTLII